MTNEELRHVGRALAAAEQALVERLGESVSAAMPEHVLASLDDAEAKEIGDDWVQEAEDELERRRQIVEADRQRRIFDDV